VEKIIAGLLFRRRHAAARRLAQLASTIPHLSDDAAIAASVVDEPMVALSLASAALFRRDASGWYRRVSALGWTGGGAAELDPFDPVLSRLRDDREPARVSAIDYVPENLPSGDAMPIVAIPIIVRGDLEAVAMYGAHTGGEDLDPDEIGALGRIGDAAGAAYYHLEADALRDTVETLGREIDRWRARARELGWSDDVASEA
jgi:hypothetical protein